MSVRWKGSPLTYQTSICLPIYFSLSLSLTHTHTHMYGPTQPNSMIYMGHVGIWPKSSPWATWCSSPLYKTRREPNPTKCSPRVFLDMRHDGILWQGKPNWISTQIPFAYEKPHWSKSKRGKHNYQGGFRRLPMEDSKRNNYCIGRKVNCNT